MSEYILPLYDGGYDVNEVFNEKDNEDIFSLHYAIKLGNIGDQNWYVWNIWNITLSLYKHLSLYSVFFYQNIDR